MEIIAPAIVPNVALLQITLQNKKRPKLLQTERRSVYIPRMIHCVVENDVPVNAVNWDYNDIRAKAEAACASAILLSSEGYEDAPPDEEKFNKHLKKALIDVATDRKADISQLINTPEGAVQTLAVLREYDMEVISNARQIRNYVTNKLIIESSNNDPRIRMRALELLGKISDVGLFTERSEITVNNRSTVELESTLKEKLKRLMPPEQTISDAVEVLPEPEQVGTIDVAAELGNL